MSFCKKYFEWMMTNGKLVRDTEDNLTWVPLTVEQKAALLTHLETE